LAQADLVIDVEMLDRDQLKAKLQQADKLLSF
jgi:tRNA 2-thiouridine synthesizing protein C